MDTQARDTGVSRFLLNDDTTPFKTIFSQGLGPPDSWDSELPQTPMETTIQEAYKVIRGREFQEAYHFLLAAIHRNLSTGFHYQLNPTFRIQVPGNQSVSFHTDALSSGHGADILNFWVPLVDLNSKNSLWFVSPSETDAVLGEFINRSLSLADLDSMARIRAKPEVLKYGEFLQFSNRVLHGTVPNTSDQTRVSFDFRILPLGANPGTKSLRRDFGVYGSALQSAIRRPAVSVAFQSGKALHLDHNSQRACINSFCDGKNLEVVREVAEWQHVDHFPMLSSLLDDFPDLALVLFSRDAFDFTTSAGKLVLDRLAIHPGGAYFAVENTALLREVHSKA